MSLEERNVRLLRQGLDAFRTGNLTESLKPCIRGRSMTKAPRAGLDDAA